MLTLRRFIMVVLAAALGGGGFAVADDREAGKSTDIQVWAIRATTKNKDISPELKSIADKLKQQSKYTGFKLERRASGSAQIGEAFTTSLIGGYSAKVTPTKSEGKRVTLQVEVLKDKDSKLKAIVTVNAGEFQLFAGPSLDGGDALIVAVSGR
jgi:hypothetical protein